VNKSELVRYVAETSDLALADVERAIDALIAGVTRAVAGGDKVAISGLGIFEPRDRAAREGRNPQSGETIQIAATTIPAFKPASAFKKAVAGR
jgi:DNA-binding protein HU-beta